MPREQRWTAPDVLDRGRESLGFGRGADGFAQLSDADRGSPLDAEDLERLATAADPIGREDDSEGAYAFLRRGQCGAKS